MADIAKSPEVGFCDYRFSVVDRAGQIVMKRDKFTSADWDRRGRLVFVANGWLCAAEVGDKGMRRTGILADLNSSKPAKLVAPPQARKW